MSLSDFTLTLLAILRKKKNYECLAEMHAGKKNKKVFYMLIFPFFKQFLLFAVCTLRYYDTKEDFLIK